MLCLFAAIALSVLSASPEAAALRGPPVEDAGGAGLRSFYKALERTELGVDGAVTRVLHLGDSSMGYDGLAHPIRSAFQERFGDAGPGFLPTAPYRKGYRSRVAAMSARGWQACYIGRLCAQDGYYGIGGHSFTGSRKTGALATFSTTAAGKLGSAVSHYEVWFAAQPNGGPLEVSLDGAAAQRVETARSELANGWHHITADRGPHTLKLQAVGADHARVFGVVAENDGPGVVWDSVTMVGAFTRRLSALDDAHIQSQVAHRRPDLLVLNFGGNDLVRFSKGSLSPGAYKEELRAVVQGLRAGRPEMSCLVAGIVDHGKSGGREVDPKHVRSMITAQRELAAEERCGFFDTVAAMGGIGGMRRWANGRPKLAASDLVHLTRRGRKRVGTLMFRALINRYEAFKGGALPAREDDD